MSQVPQQSENQRGFIHQLSPIKRSKNKNQWYDFHLQTSPTKVRRVVGFNISSHSTLTEHQESKTPIVLTNTKENKDNEILFNQQSSVRIAPPFDIGFNYATDEVLPLKTTTSSQPALDITLKQLLDLQPNQRVNVTATVSMGTEKPKQIQLKTTQVMSSVKEDCILEDKTGTSMLHVWDPLVNQITNSTTYHFQNLTVKHFQGSIHLSTSRETSFKEVEQELETLTGPALLKNPEDTVKVKEFKFVNKLAIYTSCQACKRRISEIGEKSIKCKNCGVRQRPAACNRNASAQLLVELPNIGEVWLTSFTEVLLTLLDVNPAISLQSDSDTIEEFLLDIKDIEFTYNINKKIITNILSASL